MPVGGHLSHGGQSLQPNPAGGTGSGPACIEGLSTNGCKTPFTLALSRRGRGNFLVASFEDLRSNGSLNEIASLRSQ